ncbi:MAG: hypothetical protein ACAH95_03710 [Fimbriimonas sp.]
MIGLQEAPKPAVQRMPKAKAQESFHVELSTFGKELVRYDYTMRLKFGQQPALDADWPVDVSLTDLKSQVGGKEINRAAFGSMAISLGTTGAPKGLTFLGTTLPFSLPLLSLILPESEAVEYATPTYDGSISFKGKLTMKKGAEFSVGFDSRLHVEGEARDDSMFRKFNMTSVFDPKTGNLLRSTGKYVAIDGTVNYRLTRNP